MIMNKQQGFTLIELTVTIVLSVIVVSFMTVFIAGPVQGYVDLSRRAELVNLADSALQRMSRDIHRALPNSVRISSAGPITALELLNTVDGVRYREQPPPVDSLKQLDFSAPDGAFNSVGRFTGIDKPFSSIAHYLAIYNVGVPGANAYELTNVITPPGTQIDIDTDSIAGEDNIRVSPAFQFAYGSPAQRVFLIDGPVTYLCDTGAGTLVRYSGYTITANQSDRDSDVELLAAGATRALISNQLAGCAVLYAPGSSERAGLVSLQLGIAAAGETISLLHQVHVDNVP
jgi:MSHA biogenesis protein MshO